jgi:hypothetical protein
MKISIKTMLSITVLLLLTTVVKCYATNPNKYVTNQASIASFPLASKGNTASILVSTDDFSGVIKVAGHLQNDIKNITGTTPTIHKNTFKDSDYLIIIGTIGKSTIIDKLVGEGKVDGKEIQGKWEKFTTQIVDNPIAGVKKALVIAGSDKRGTIYGMYDLSNQIGVSPWSFWADVPVKKQSELHVLPGIHTLGEPKVKYRGIFINDEAPALTGWAYENYGGFNAKFYDKVFELILRMKGNYLWPAMWGRMFYVDDPQNAVLADEYGIVMGTSHHEPSTRAHAEWEKSNMGKWDFSTNSDNLKKFWTAGMERMGNRETIVSIGMRGDGDEPMTEGTAIELLENIVKTQRDIITNVTKKPIEETPQMWALYKEVQDYYDKGMRVPDDVTLLLCDDNWGNIRKLPNLDSKPRKGGYGIYYHYDYVGGPRNYKWINTNQIERTWEQMHMAYQYGADRVWIVNVGDIKPMEFPIEFFLDYAWNPDAWNANNLNDYYIQWAKENFDGQFTQEIAQILKLYTKYNARRKPELLDSNTYSLVNYNEAESIVKEYTDLAQKAEAINEKIKPEYKDAFYQLILFPVLAGANLNDLYLATAKNHLYANQGRISANDYAQKVKDLFGKDAELTDYYHKTMANGKWNHMMSQTHIGYTYWQQPKENSIPETTVVQAKDDPEVGVSIEGSTNWWPNAIQEAILPTLNSYEKQSSYIDIFNRGSKPFSFSIRAKENWIKFSKTKGTIDKEERITIQIDWKKAPKGDFKTSFIIDANKKIIPISIPSKNIDLNDAKGFVESNGIVSIEAKDYVRTMSTSTHKWTIIPNLGRTDSGISLQPSNSSPIEIANTSPRLEYDVHLFSQGNIKVHAYFSPTINFTTREGLKYGIAFDDETPQIVNFNKDDSDGSWNAAVANNIKITTTDHIIKTTGNHILKFFAVDSGLLLQKIIIETEKGDLKQTYLGPPESYNTTINNTLTSKK